MAARSLSGVRAFCLLGVWSQRCVAAASKCLLCFRTGREGLEARAGILFHGPLSGRPIREYTGLPSCPYHVKFLRHAESLCLLQKFNRRLKILGLLPNRLCARQYCSASEDHKGGAKGLS